MEVKKPDSSSESSCEGISDGTAPAAGVDRSHSKHSSSSRKIWSEKGSESGEGERGEDTSEHGSTAVHVEAVMSAAGGGKGRSAAASAEKFSKLAKYAVHHLPHPESRCASRLVSFRAVYMYHSLSIFILSLEHLLIQTFAFTWNIAGNKSYLYRLTTFIVHLLFRSICVVTILLIICYKWAEKGCIYYSYRFWGVIDNQSKMIFCP